MLHTIRSYFNLECNEATNDLQYYVTLSCDGNHNDSD